MRLLKKWKKSTRIRFAFFVFTILGIVVCAYAFERTSQAASVHTTFGATDLESQQQGLAVPNDELLTGTWQDLSKTPGATSHGRALVERNGSVTLTSALSVPFGQEPRSRVPFRITFEPTDTAVWIQPTCALGCATIPSTLLYHPKIPTLKQTLNEKGLVFYLPEEYNGGNSDSQIISSLPSTSQVFISEDATRDFSFDALIDNTALQTLTEKKKRLSLVPFAVGEHQEYVVATGTQATFRTYARHIEGASVDAAAPAREREARVTIEFRTLQNALVTRKTVSPTQQPQDLSFTLPAAGVYRVVIKTTKPANQRIQLSSTVPYFWTQLLTANTAARSLQISSLSPFTLSIKTLNSPQAFRMVRSDGVTIDGAELKEPSTTIPAGSYTVTVPPESTLRTSLVSIGETATPAPLRVGIAPSIASADAVVSYTRVIREGNAVTAISSFPPDIRHAPRVSENHEGVHLQISQSGITADANFGLLLATDYFPLAKTCNTTIYSSKSPNVPKFQEYASCTQNDIQGMVRNAIPEYAGVTFRSDAVRLQDFTPESVRTDSGVDTETTRSYSVGLRGSSRLQFIAGSRIALLAYIKNMNSTEGSDEAMLQLLDSNGTVVASTLVPDDGNVSKTAKSGDRKKITLEKDGLVPGLYTLTLETRDKKQQDDIGLDAIDVNTNRLVAPEGGRFYKPNTVFTQNNTLFHVLDIYSYSRKQSEEYVEIPSIQQRIGVSIKNRKTTRQVILPKGRHSIHTPDTDVRISNMPLAFTEDSYMEPNLFYSGNSYIVTEQPAATPLLFHSLTIGRIDL